MNTDGNIRQDSDLRTAKHFLTNISNRRAERFYYADGAPKYSVIQIDSILVMNVIERLVARVETLEANQNVVKTKPQLEVRKRRFSVFPTSKWWVKRKAASSGIVVNYIPWWGRPIEHMYNLFH